MAQSAPVRRGKASIVACGLAVAAVFQLAACGEVPGPPHMAEQRAEGRAISAQEREAAALLSFAGTGTPERGNPYENSVACASSLGVLVTALEGAGALSTEQLTAIRQASRLYETRAVELAAGADRTAQQTRSEIARARAETDARDSSLATTALACLQRLGATS